MVEEISGKAFEEIDGSLTRGVGDKPLNLYMDRMKSLLSTSLMS